MNNLEPWFNRYLWCNCCQDFFLFLLNLFGFSRPKLPQKIIQMEIVEKMRTVDWLSMMRVTACISICFAEGFQMSLNGPFYPEEAIKKNLDQTKIGLATGSQYLARLIGSIIILMVVNVRSQNFFFIVGAVTAGLTSVAFAFLIYVPGVWPFFIISSFLRFMIGLFSAGIQGCSNENKKA